MRNAKVGALIVAVTVGGLWLLHRPEARKPGTYRKIATQTIEDVKRERASPSFAAPLAASSPGAVAATAPVARVVEPIPYAAELGRYSLLHRKVFLKDGEADEKAQLLKNPAVLRSMGTRLMRSPVNQQAAEDQIAALDMLFEALKSGDSDVAAQVLRGVVTDGQVEDEHLDRVTRENLAGVKAEVLYQWSSLEPARASELASMLPGPVSQKIWSNVVTQQASNIAESVDAP